MAIARAEGYEIYALTFNYRQRHSREIEAATKIAEFFNVKEHLILNIDLKKIGGSALTADIKVPKGRKEKEIGERIPVTYVPARNTIFLALALAWAEVLGAEDIFIGANALDYSGYPDCRPEYIKAFEFMANLATKAGVEGRSRIKIHAPLINLTKAEIIQKGVSLGVDYRMTHSCYDPTPKGLPCGLCDSCILRKKGFAEAGIADPLIYADTS